MSNRDEFAARSFIPENKAMRANDKANTANALRFARSEDERKEIIREAQMRSFEKTIAHLEHLCEEYGIKWKSARVEWGGLRSPIAVLVDPPTTEEDA